VYRKGISIIAVIILLMFISSCHRLRINDSRKDRYNYEMNSVRFFNDVESKNIISRPISVSKISIVYESVDERRRLKANMKTDGSGSMLISIRTFAGIEAARVLITKDTVKIADRINRIYYVGSTKQIEVKYGIKYDFIDLLFGDFKRINQVKNRIRCENGIVQIVDQLNNIRYIVDCTIYKVIEVEGKVKEGTQDFKGYFKEFRNENGILYPGIINWELEDGITDVSIEMEKVRISESKELIFKVGNNYKRKVLR